MVSVIAAERGRAALAAAADPRFRLEEFEPSYLALARVGGFPARVAAARAELEDCRACPRDCGVNRTAGELGTCKTGRHAFVASAFPHFGEEDCLRGWRGSGTIFFSWCNLKCVFCQNWDISQQEAGAECSAGEIADLMLGLQAHGCHNVNFVTPEHVVPQVVEALAEAVSPGTYVNVMGQYRPEHKVAGAGRYADIDTPVGGTELSAAVVAARRAGLWRLDQRVLPW